MLISILLAVLPLYSNAENLKVACERNYSHADNVFTFYPECSNDGVIQKRKIMFTEYKGLARDEVYKQGLLASSNYYNTEGQQTASFSYSYPELGTFVRTQLNIKTGEFEGRSEYIGSSDINGESTETKRWISKNGKFVYIEHFVPQSFEISQIDFLDSDENITKKVVLQYNQFNVYPPAIRGFTILDAKGRIVGKFEKDGVIDVPTLIREKKYSAKREQDLIQKFQTPRRPLMVIDTGFDVRHPDLLQKMFYNPFEPIDGIDNDGNGLVDDVFGWDAIKKTPDIRDNLFRPEGMPYSHGTHVASISLRDIESYGLIGLAGDMAKTDIFRIASGYIKKQGVQYVNMSFGWEDTKGAADPFVPGDGSTNALESLIQGAPDTLFVVAASNEGKELSHSGFCVLPVCFPYQNMLRVGALNVSSYSKSDLVRSQIADFSNYGKDIVDIFSPGEEILAAGLGDQYVAFSGTSMASPNALNILLRMSEVAPQASAKKLKEILLKSAYIPDLNAPLPCRSGGMIYPERALAVTKLYVESLSLKSQSVDQLVLQVRTQGLLLNGEDNSAASALKLMEIWQKL